MSSTKSEALFISLCNSLSLTVEKIPESQTKTPDFRVTTTGGVFLAEVKDLRPNEEEKRLLREFREKRPVCVVSELGRRARGMIENAKRQLREFKGQCLPGVIVLYDNIKLDDGTSLGPRMALSPDHINAAMFGQWVVDLQIEKGTGKIVVRNDRCGPNESFTRYTKNYVSAVAVICDYFGPLTITLYHNPYADYPLPLNAFCGPNCYNFRVSNENAKKPQSWIRCDHEASA